MEFVGVPIAIAVMLLAQTVERRVGAAAAGWFAALPIAFGVAAAAIAVTDTAADASSAALSAAGHTGPMVVYAVAFVAIGSRLGAVRGFLLAAPVYIAASLLLRPLPATACVVIGLLAIAAGTFHLTRQPRPVRSGVPSSALQQVLSLASAGAVVALISVANQLAGPVVAGAVGAFPVMTTTMALFLAYRSGSSYAVYVMHGLVRSLPVYATYCLAFSLAVTRMDLVWAVALSTGAALIVAAVTWRTVAQAEFGDDVTVLAEP